MVWGASSFWYQAGVNSVGPLVSAVVGLLIVGLAVNRYTGASQDRRIDSEFRYELISEITDAASTLFHQIAMYDRARGGVDDLDDTASEANEEVREQRRKLLELYPVSRARTDVLEERLAAYFAEPCVALAWHAVVDCLSIRYHNAARGKNWEQFCRRDSKGWDDKFHSGLSEEQLADPRMVASAYRVHLKTTAKLIFVSPLRQRRASRRIRRQMDRIIKQARDDGFDYDCVDVKAT
jgi:hypothetical protein